MDQKTTAKWTALPKLPPDLENELAAMHLFSEEELWKAVKPSILPKEQQRLAELNYMAGGGALTKAEMAEQDILLKAYDYSLVRRSQALGILVQRGHTISPETLSRIDSNYD